MSDYGEVPPEIVARLRAVCVALPEAYEEPAWVGTRWRIRKKTFAHVLAVYRDHPPAYVRAAAVGGPAVVMTFRAAGQELDALKLAGYPFFKPGWGADVVGIVLGEDTDWDEVAELLTESYCVLAPKKLVALVERPSE